MNDVRDLLKCYTINKKFLVVRITKKSPKKLLLAKVKLLKLGNCDNQKVLVVDIGFNY